MELILYNYNLSLNQIKCHLLASELNLRQESLHKIFNLNQINIRLQKLNKLERINQMYILPEFQNCLNFLKT